MDEEVGADTGAGFSKTIPEIVDRTALEDSEEKENQANGGGKRDSGVKNVGVDAVHGDAQKSDDDGYLGDDTGNDIEDLAQPPTLYNHEISTLHHCVDGKLLSHTSKALWKSSSLPSK